MSKTKVNLNKVKDIHDIEHKGITGDTPITCINGRWYTIEDLKEETRIVKTKKR